MARAAFGTLFQMGNGAATEVFTTVAEVRDITGPGFQTDVVDTSNHSTPSGFEEAVATLRRTGEITFTIGFDAQNPTHGSTSMGGGTNGLFNLFQNGTRRNFRMIMPASTGYVRLRMSSYVTGFSLNHPVAGDQSADVTVKPTGVPTWSTSATTTG